MIHSLCQLVLALASLISTASALAADYQLYNYRTKKVNLQKFFTMATLRLAFTLMVASVAISVVLVSAQDTQPTGPVSVWSVQNAFPNSKLFMQCSSDIGQQKVAIVPPLVTHTGIFYPDGNAYMLCTIYTAAPTVWGRFHLYVRNPSFQPCYNNCTWKADENGLTLMSEGGLTYLVFYAWQRRH